MSLYKKGKIYHYDFRCGNVRFQGSTRCTTLREAQQFEKDARVAAAAEVAKRNAETREPAIPTVSQVVERLIAAREGNRQDAERYSDNLRYLARKIGSDLPITKLTDGVLKDLVASEKAASKRARRQIKLREDQHSNGSAKSC